MYDIKCHDLAEAFLVDACIHSSNATSQLAQEIQEVIEDFINNYEPSESEQGLIPIPDGYAEH